MNTNFSVKILLVNPWKPEIFPIPGLAYIQSYIKSKLPNSAIEYADISNVQKCAYSAKNYDFIGFTVHSFAVPNVVRLLPNLKGLFPRAKFIAGGHHASILPHQMLEIGFDQVVIGPGEEAFLDIILGNESKIVHGSISTGLDNLPLPAFTSQQGDWHLPDSPRSAFPIISSRGCPFRCSFCSSSQFWGRKWLFRSPENIINEISYWLKSGVIETFMFEDDNFTLDRVRAIEICRMIKTTIIPRFPSLEWQAASRAESLRDVELCRAMVEAGCKRVWLGLESGSQAILDGCSKDTRVENQLEGIEVAAACGLATNGQFIVGLKGESQQTVEETKKFIRKSKLDTVMANKAWILPGTDLYEAAKSRGFQDSYYIHNGVPFFTIEHDLSTLEVWCDQIKKEQPSVKIKTEYKKNINFIDCNVDIMSKNYQNKSQTETKLFNLAKTKNFIFNETIIKSTISGGTKLTTNPSVNSRTRILIVLAYKTKDRMRGILRDHLECFEKYADAEVSYLNFAYDEDPRRYIGVPFDLIIFHTLFMSLHWARKEFRELMDSPQCRLLLQFPGIKIAMPQDEFVNSDGLCEFINEYAIDHVFSVSPASEWYKIYNAVNFSRVRFHHVLTGFLDDDRLHRILTPDVLYQTRPIDLGYRAVPIYWLGRHGLLKAQVAELFSAYAPQYGLTTNISIDRNDNFLEDQWFRFIASCKYLIGVEGGSSVLDRDGQIMRSTAQYLNRYPNVTFEELESACFPGVDGQLSLFALSPRHLEACATRTCQILVEGDYNGVLKPGIHYLELKKDFSNIHQVLVDVKEDRLRESIVERAYQDIVVSGRYTYRAFVNNVVETCLQKSPTLVSSDITGMSNATSYMRNHTKHYRILVGTCEIAGLLPSYADGFRKLGHQVTSVITQRNRFYPNSLYDVDLSQESPEGKLRVICQLIEEHDIFLFQWAGESFFKGNTEYPLLKERGKKIITVFNGSDVRHHSAYRQWCGVRLDLLDPATYEHDPLARPLLHIRTAELFSDLILSLPNQSVLGVRPYMHSYLPIVLGKYSFKIPGRDIPRVVHAPSNKGIKGTAFILDALERLRSEGVNFELRLLDGVPNEQVLAELSEADVAVDQLFIVLYGVFSLEAMASGCAVATVDPRGGMLEPIPEKRPLWPITPETVYSQLRQLLTNKELRIRLAHEGRRFVEQYHDHVRVADRIVRLVEEPPTQYDHSPSFFSRFYCPPRNVRIPEELQSATEEIIRRHGLPIKADIRDMVERGLVPESMVNSNIARRW